MNWYAVTGGMVDGDDFTWIYQADDRQHAIDQFVDTLRDGEDVDNENIIISSVVVSRTEIILDELPEILDELQELTPPPAHPAPDTPDPTTLASHFIT